MGRKALVDGRSHLFAFDPNLCTRGPIGPDRVDQNHLIGAVDQGKKREPERAAIERDDTLGKRVLPDQPVDRGNASAVVGADDVPEP